MTGQEALAFLREHHVEFLDLRLTDLFGGWHHIMLPMQAVDESLFEAGLPFDGSSLRGYRHIEESDMVLLPDPGTIHIDPFTARPTAAMQSNVYDPQGQPYARDPRGVAQRAERALIAAGIADSAYFGPELEFFVFDDVRMRSATNEAFYHLDSAEAEWNSGRDEGPNLGYKIRGKEGYVPLPPSDQLSDLRSEMVTQLMGVGIEVERHHHEVATAGQGEIGMRFQTLTTMADHVLLYKHIVRNVAHHAGKVATFMPKPLYGDNGSGMHTHQSLFKNGQNLFHDEKAYGRLSAMGRSYLAGVLTHAPALLALTNPTTNSYRRLVPGFEAPVNLVFAKGNRSAAIRIPSVVSSPKAVRIEFRTPDPTANPYLAFAAMLMAGLDGIRRNLDPEREGFGPWDVNTYELSAEERARIKSVPGSLEEALDQLERDHDFLLHGEVFSEDLIDAWVQEKRRRDVDGVRVRPHPYEFQLYLDA